MPPSDYYIYITSTQQKWKGKAHSFNKKYCYKVNSLIRPYCHYSLPCDTYIYLLNWQGQFNNNGPKSTSTNCWHHVIVNSLCSGREVTKCKKKKIQTHSDIYLLTLCSAAYTLCHVPKCLLLHTSIYLDETYQTHISRLLVRWCHPGHRI